MSPTQPLLIEIVSDVVCPWCFIGLRRLELAIDAVRRKHPDFECIKHWRPFFLNPDTPPEGEPYLPFLEQKFGGRERVQAVFQHVRDAGATYGLDYDFARQRRLDIGTRIRNALIAYEFGNSIYWRYHFGRTARCHRLCGIHSCCRSLRSFIKQGWKFCDLTNHYGLLLSS